MLNPKLEAVKSAICPQPRTEITQAEIPMLPNEILESVLKILQEKGEFKTLTSVARVNKNMYDIVIPKIYKTVIVNKRNRRKIGYGHGDPTSNSESAINDKSLTRKDFATTFTRKLVFEFEPETAIPKSYRAVEEVVFGPACMKIARYLHVDVGESGKSGQADRVGSLFAKCLTTITSTGGLATFLHVQVHMIPRIDYEVLRNQLKRLDTAIPVTYEFFDVPMDWVTQALELGYTLQAVVHYVNDGAAPQDVLAQDLADQISDLLAYGVSGSASEVYLCNVPQLVLRPDEFDSADDVNEVAIVKICGLIDNRCWPNQVTTPDERWEFLKSKIKLVEAGFRPTKPHIATTQDPTESSNPSPTLGNSS